MDPVHEGIKGGVLILTEIEEDQTGNGFYIVWHIFDLRSLQVCQQLKCGAAIDLTGCLV